MLGCWSIRYPQASSRIPPQAKGRQTPRDKLQSLPLLKYEGVAAFPVPEGLQADAAEHSTAVLMALRNKLALAMHIAIGSSIQIALFVAPVLVFASLPVNSHWPLDLHFTPLEIMAVSRGHNTAHSRTAISKLLQILIHALGRHRHRNF